MQKLSHHFTTYIIGLISLWNLGRPAFVDAFSFIAWMVKRNYFFNNRAPITYLKSIEGIAYTSNMLGALDHPKHI